MAKELTKEQKKIIFTYFNERQEQALMAYIDNLKKNGFTEEDIRSIYFGGTRSGERFMGNLAHYSTLYNLPLLLKKLFKEYQFNPNQIIYYLGNRADLNKLSCLILAAEQNHFESIKVLLAEENINILCTNGLNESVLMLSENENIQRLILQTAKQKNSLDALLGIKQQHNLDILSYVKISFLKILSEIEPLEHFKKILNFKVPLIQARHDYWNSNDSKQQEELDTLCRELKLLVCNKTSSPYELNYDTEAAYQALYDTDPPSTNQSVDEAIKYAIAQFYALLSSPSTCDIYLRKLNRQIENAYWLETRSSFQTINPDSYRFQKINDLMFPIPKEDYKGLKKHHILQRYLIQFFKQHDLAFSAEKWIGFIPEDKANEAIANGVFFLEDARGPGLFHNKYAHMLQQAIFLFAIQDNKIDMQSGGIKLTPKQVLAGLVKYKNNNDEFLWGKVRDTRPYYRSFSDPHRLGATIMLEGKLRGYKTLSTILIDSFCKGFQKLLTMHQVITGNKNLTAELLAKQMDDVELHIFNIEKKYFDYALKEEKKKSNKILNEGDDYCMVKREYKPLACFKPLQSFFNKSISSPKRNSDSSEEVENIEKMQLN